MKRKMLRLGLCAAQEKEWQLYTDRLVMIKDHCGLSSDGVQTVQVKSVLFRNMRAEWQLF